MLTLFFKSDDDTNGSTRELIISTSLKDDVNAICKGYEILNNMPNMDKFCLYRAGKQVSTWLV